MHIFDMFLTENSYQFKFIPAYLFVWFLQRTCFVFYES